MNSKASLLIVDDETVVRDSLGKWFEEEGFTVETASSARDALLKLPTQRWDLALVDIKMPGIDGLELQRKIREIDPETLVIIMTGYASVETAVQAMRDGAYDYITKPFDPDDLAHLVRKALEHRRTKLENVRLRESLEEIQAVEMVGQSKPMQRVVELLRTVAPTDTTVLIRGESGTGKELVARTVHALSPRRYMPMVVIHCGALTETLLESELFGHERGAFTGATQRKVGLCETADGGTLFLDDINVVPNEIQAKLLRFIENKTFVRLGGTQDLKADVRIVAASNEDLEALCREGRFREDLYFRLKVILIDLPPLRERPEDTIAIALDYLKRSCGEKGIALKTLSPETIQLFQKAPWRGNVRELQNVLERVVILSDDTIIVPESLPEDFLRDAMGTSKQSQRRLDELVEEIIKLGGYSETSPLLPMLEALIVKKMVGYASGKGQAAQLLGISKPTLYARLRDYEKLR